MYYICSDVTRVQSSLPPMACATLSIPSTYSISPKSLLKYSSINRHKATSTCKQPPNATPPSKGGLGTSPLLTLTRDIAQGCLGGESIVFMGVYVYIRVCGVAVMLSCSVCSVMAAGVDAHCF